MIVLHPRHVLFAEGNPRPEHGPQQVILGRVMMVQHREDVDEMSGYHFGPPGVAGLDASDEIRSVSKFTAENIDERHLERVGRHRRTPRSGPVHLGLCAACRRTLGFAAIRSPTAGYPPASAVCALFPLVATPLVPVDADPLTRDGDRRMLRLCRPPHWTSS